MLQFSCIAINEINSSTNTDKPEYKPIESTLDAFRICNSMIVGSITCNLLTTKIVHRLVASYNHVLDIKKF